MSKKKKNQTKKSGLTIIHWDDHYSSTLTRGWKGQGDDIILTPVLVKSAGYVVKEDKDVVMLAQNFDASGEVFGNIIAIIKSCIKKREVL